MNNSDILGSNTYLPTEHSEFNYVISVTAICNYVKGNLIINNSFIGSIFRVKFQG